MRVQLDSPEAAGELGDFLLARIDGVVRRSEQDSLEIWLLGSQRDAVGEAAIESSIREWASTLAPGKCRIEVNGRALAADRGFR